MPHQKQHRCADWRTKLTSTEAAELGEIDARVVEIERERQVLTDRRRRIYDRASKRERVPLRDRAA